MGVIINNREKVMDFLDLTEDDDTFAVLSAVMTADSSFIGMTMHKTLDELIEGDTGQPIAGLEGVGYFNIPSGMHDTFAQTLSYLYLKKAGRLSEYEKIPRYDHAEWLLNNTKYMFASGVSNFLYYSKHWNIAEVVKMDQLGIETKMWSYD